MCRRRPTALPPCARPGVRIAKLRAAVRSLREAGDTVVCVLPGHEHEGQEFDCDRELLAVDGRWVLRALVKRQPS